jgi:WD40 repeat protein
MNVTAAGAKQHLLDASRDQWVKKSCVSPTTMAPESSSPKRQKIGMKSEESRVAMSKAIDTILNIDFAEFKGQVGDMDFDSCRSLSECLSALGQVITSAVALNMFHNLETPTADWDDFALISKEFNKTETDDKDTEEKDITPPCLKSRLIEKIDEHARPTFSHDGEFIAYGNCEGLIYILSRRKGLVATWKGHDRNSSVSFSPSSNLLISTGSDKKIKLWDLDCCNRCCWTREDPESHDQVAFSPTGTFFATFGCVDPAVCLRNSSDGSILKTITSDIILKFGVALSPNGRTLAVCGSGDAIELWNLADSESTATMLHGHRDSLRDIVFSPDGKFLASASCDRSIKIWDMANPGRCIVSLWGHTAEVTCVSFSSNGKFLASGSMDQDIRVWSQATGKCVETVKADNDVQFVKFSKDGKMIFTKEGRTRASQCKLWLRYVCGYMS